MKTPNLKKLFNEDETKLIQNAVLRTWDEIGYDLLQAVAADKGKDVNAVTISRSEVIEVSLDAGRPEDVMRSALRNWAPAAALDLMTRWNALDYSSKIKLVKPVFTYTRYGM